MTRPSGDPVLHLPKGLVWPAWRTPEYGIGGPATVAVLGLVPAAVLLCTRPWPADWPQPETYVALVIFGCIGALGVAAGLWINVWNPLAIRRRNLRALRSLPAIAEWRTPDGRACRHTAGGLLAGSKMFAVGRLGFNSLRGWIAEDQSGVPDSKPAESAGDAPYRAPVAFQPRLVLHLVHDSHEVEYEPSQFGEGLAEHRVKPLYLDVPLPEGPDGVAVAAALQRDPRIEDRRRGTEPPPNSDLIKFLVEGPEAPGA